MRDLVVTKKQVVHRADCSHASGPCTTALPFDTRDAMHGDRACSRCLPGGIPYDAPVSSVPDTQKD